MEGPRDDRSRRRQFRAPRPAHLAMRERPVRLPRSIAKASCISALLAAMLRLANLQAVRRSGLELLSPTRKASESPTLAQVISRRPWLKMKLCKSRRRRSWEGRPRPYPCSCWSHRSRSPRAWPRGFSLSHGQMQMHPRTLFGGRPGCHHARAHRSWVASYPEATEPSARHHARRRRASSSGDQHP